MDINDIKDIVFILMIFLIIYLVFKTRNLENLETKVSEGFETTTPAANLAIKQAVNDQYKADIDAIRNLAQISRNILSGGDVLKIPANTMKVSHLAPLEPAVRVTVTARELAINGNLQLDGTAMCMGTRTCYNLNQMDFLLPYSIILFYRGPGERSIPWGWALCDGKYYKYDKDNKRVIETGGSDADAIKTPDLRGRFIMGAGRIPTANLANSDSTFGTTAYEREYSFPEGETGGENKHKLSVAEMPIHRHYFGRDYWDRWGENSGGVDLGDYTKNPGSNDWSGRTNYEGGDEAHNNIPPYVALTYIMRIL